MNMMNCSFLMNCVVNDVFLMPYKYIEPINFILNRFGVIGGLKKGFWMS